MPELTSSAQMRRDLMLQTLYNGHVELERPLSARLGIAMRDVECWLRLKEPSHSWPRDMVLRIPVGSGVVSMALAPADAAEHTRGWLAVVCSDGMIHVLDPAKGRPVRMDERDLSWSAHTDKVEAMAWHKDGHLLSAGRDYKVKLWRAAADSVCRHRNLSSSDGFASTCAWFNEWELDYTSALAFGPDGRLARISSNGTIEVIDPRSGPDGEWRDSWHDAHTPPSACTGHHRHSYGLAWSGHGRLAAGSDWYVSVWRPDRPQNEPEWIGRGKGDIQRVYAVAWSDDGRLASAGVPAPRSSEDGPVPWCSPIEVWDPSPGHAEPVWIGRCDPFEIVMAVAWDHTGQVAAACSGGGVVVWRPGESSEPAWVGLGHEGECTSVVWLTDGRLVSGSEDGTIGVWQPAEGRGESLRTQIGPKQHCAAWQANGRLAVWPEGGSPEIWDPDSGGERMWCAAAGMTGPSENFNPRLAWSAGGLLAATNIKTSHICLWSPDDTSEPVSTLDTTNTPSRLAWSSDGRLAAVVGTDVLIWQFHGNHGRINSRINFPEKPDCLAWSSDGLLAAGCIRTISVYSPAASDQPIWMALAPTDHVYDLAWSNRGMLVSTGV